jgi:hypothetical protein
MPLSPAIVRETPASRRLRRYAPLLLAIGLSAAALLPGVIAGDRPFQRSLCIGDPVVPDSCAPPSRTAAAEPGKMR